jgi:hypothetical protein
MKLMTLRSRRLYAVTSLALALSVICATVALAASPPVPRTDQQRIVASFGRTFLPGWLPPGYVFSRWESRSGSATVYGDILLIAFGKHGDLIQWTVGDARDPDGYAGDACSKHPFRAVLIRIGNRRIVFQSGNHGADATLCLHGLAITVWNGHTLTPRTQARIAAGAHAVG